MFVLDTNVVSELMRERPNPEVLGWMDNQLTGNLVVTDTFSLTDVNNAGCDAR